MVWHFVFMQIHMSIYTCRFFLVTGNQRGRVLQFVPLPAAGADQSGQSKGALRVWGLQGLHRLGSLGCGKPSAVLPCPPQCSPHLCPATHIPQKTTAVLSHPQQGQLLQGLLVQDLPGHGSSKTPAASSSSWDAAHLHSGRLQATLSGLSGSLRPTEECLDKASWHGMSL